MAVKKGNYVILRLPCGHANVELTRREDRYVVCPVCLKKYVLTWSLRPKVKWREEGRK